ncbi:MAG TPA: hypothetical protein VIE67_00845 [Rudaea sp.]|uniref:hypothetical protein n=1 Tax=Rudaea sp. TaxID=2136325 RepID=UPI002F95B76C
MQARARYTAQNGWVDFDPTNNVLPDLGHITLAWGRATATYRRCAASSSAAASTN